MMNASYFGWHYMTPSKSLPNFIIAVVVLPALVIGANAADPRVSSVISQWEARAKQVKSLRCEASGEFIYPKDRLYEGIKISEKGAFRWNFTRGLALDFVNQRHRLEIVTQSIGMPEGTLTPVEETYAYNGSELYHLRTRTKNQRPEAPLPPDKPDLGIMTGYVEDCQFESRDYPVFYAAGRIVPIWEKLVAGRMVPRFIDPDLFVLHGESILNGRRCTILRSRPEKGLQTHFDEYWVDVERQGVILRHTLFTNDTPQFQTTIDYSRQGEYWLPTSWRDVSLAAGRVVRYEERVTSVAVTINPDLADSTFVVHEEPGMLVSKSHWASPVDPKKPLNPVLNSNERFRIGADGSATRVEFRDGVEVVVRHKWWAWTLGGVAVGGVGLFFILRHRSRIRLQSPDTVV
jgi:hypothetical protein